MDKAVDTMLTEAENTVAYAQLVRRHHRRRTKKTNLQRQTDIELGLERIHKTMVPIRSALTRLRILDAEHPYVMREEPLREASQALQSERRKLWKMKAR